MCDNDNPTKTNLMAYRIAFHAVENNSKYKIKPSLLKPKAKEGIEAR